MAAQDSFGNFIKSAPPPVKKRVLLLLSMAGAFVLGAFITISWIWKLHRGPSLPEAVLESSRKLAGHEPVSFQHAYEIKDMSMAILNKKGTRTAYSQFTIIFDCATEACLKAMELNRAKLINTIFEVGSDFYVEDFEAPLAKTGFKRFKDKLLEKTTEFFGKQGPHVIVFKDWVMN